MLSGCASVLCYRAVSDRKLSRCRVRAGSGALAARVWTVDPGFRQKVHVDWLGPGQDATRLGQCSQVLLSRPRFS